MFILKKGHQPGVYVPLRALFLVSLSKTLYSPKVLVIPRKRWLHPDMTEKLLTGTLNLNTNKQTNLFNPIQTLIENSVFLAHLSRRLKGELIVYRSIRRRLVRASVGLKVNIFKLEYLRNQWANRNQILSEASLGWGIDCIRFWTR